jgi:hypothetical protein
MTKNLKHRPTTTVFSSGSKLKSFFHKNLRNLMVGIMVAGFPN